ncbi:MAG: DUF2125 domain-containing protein [Proteobacteria bacterium]|nr:DUF2125 domain-containing protein [Pseudomonadota bacterium]
MWMLASDLAQEKLIGSINKTKNFRIEVGEIKKSGYPKRINLELRNVKVYWSDKDTNQKLTLKAGDMSMSTDFLAQQRVEVVFDKNQSLIYEVGGEASHYTLLVDGGKLSLFQQQHVSEIQLGVNSMTLRNDDSQKTVLKTADAYFSKESASMNANNFNSRLTANKLTVESENGPETLNALNVDANVTAFPPQLTTDVVSWLFKPAEREQLTEKIVKQLASNASYFELNDVRLERNDFWITMRGQFQLDNRLRPDGNVSLTTNMPDPLMAYLREHEVINDIALSQNKYVLKLLSDNRDKVSLRFECTDGNLSLQGAPVGVVPPVTEWAARG